MSLENSTRLSTSNVITIFAKDSVIDNTKAGFFLDGKKAIPDLTNTLNDFERTLWNEWIYW